MQRKHLIAFTLATIALLLGFNMINGNTHEKNRAALVDNETPVAAELNTASDSNNNDVAAQPLVEQPKAIMDNVNTQIDEAQQIESERLEQMDNAQ